MSGLLQNEPFSAPIKRHGADVLFVNSFPHSHSAAKFWSSLYDEIEDDFQACTRLVMESCDGETFCGDLLYPELELNNAARAVAEQSLADCLRSIAFEMEICGSPSAVVIRLYNEEEELLVRELPLDCVDTELFPYLAVWLLEWADVPELSWNAPSLSGLVVAHDRRRSKVYSFDFELLNSPLHEGLFRRTLSMRLQRTGCTSELP